MSNRILGLLLALAVAACAPHQIYHPETAVCTVVPKAESCTQNALQEYRDPNDPSADYLLAFVEFDDQGQLWDRNQMTAVVDEIRKREGDSRDTDVLMVAFVHGWKHSADSSDSNVLMFRKNLAQISRLESQFSRSFKGKPREVVGIYFGWRGGSVEADGIKELTFWDRKATAEKVGHGGVTEALLRLELLQKQKDALVAQCRSDGRLTGSRTRLVVIGHSFGGAVVHSALSQILQERFVDTFPNDVCDESKRQQLRTAESSIRGFGNLVVLINPAFEAARFATLSDMANERGSYFKNQRPVLAILTSKADDATRKAFPLGRGLSTIFETERPVPRKDPVSHETVTIDQGESNVTAVGHFAPYRTHYLHATEDAKNLVKPDAHAELRALRSVRDGWLNDKPGNEIQFYGSRLVRTMNSVARNPYLIIYVDGDLIPGHNEIDDPRIAAFVRELMFLTEIPAK